jgi:hypothetical protein
MMFDTGEKCSRGVVAAAMLPEVDVAVAVLLFRTPPLLHEPMLPLDDTSCAGDRSPMLMMCVGLPESAG